MSDRVTATSNAPDTEAPSVRSAPPPEPPPTEATPDRIDAALGLIRWSLILLIVSVGTVALGPFVFSQEDRLVAQSVLPAERLAFEPAGRIQRVPASHPAIHGHFVPGLAGLAPDPMRLVLPEPRGGARP